LFQLVTVPRTTCDCEAAVFLWSSSHFLRFFCLIRQAYRLRLNSTLRTAEVRKCDVDDDADANVAAAALEDAGEKVLYVL
jgi:hypothetical protein